MLLVRMRLMVLTLMMNVLTFMTLIMILIMILMMILTMILMMILMTILTQILMMVGAGTEDRSREEPYTFPPLQSPPLGGGIFRIWIASERGKGRG